MGVVRFATLSDGTVISALGSFKKHQRTLRKAQQSLSRKVKGSNNWKKQKRKIAKIHARIADVRNDYLHKASTAISKNHAVVVLEDMAVKNMSASAKGTVENPGRNVRQNSGLNRSILDQGWYEFRRQWSTSSGGAEALSLPCHPATPAAHARLACEVSGATMPRLSAVGITVLQVGEDVNLFQIIR